MGCFNGRPEMDIELTNTDSNAVSCMYTRIKPRILAQIFQQSQVSLGLVEEKIRRCLLSAVTNINLSEALPPNPDDWRMDETQLIDNFHDRSYHDQVVN
ncbi:unnamed protein product [Cylicostephanus goldi]|uniref:Uncharacterized protein n=1 Tax=Cylicostephanus goldi TaxID=71465 RepID=A0A3P6RM22_CYLGO|nr:unnamed protein product [Cylicostephanus goldi]